MADGLKHKLVAILAADIVAYSRLMEADQAGTHSQLGVSRKEVVDPAIAEHGGRTFKTTGDGFLVEFPSPLNAVRCALAIQQDMARRNEHVPDASRIVFRIGVNLGDVIIEGDDLYGNGVNIASRLESICEPGGVCISSKVHDEVSGETGLKFTDRGPQTVKNIAKPVQAYAVGFSEGPKSVIAAAARPSRITAGSAISVAILVAIVGVFAWQTTRDSVEVADRANPASGKPSIAVLAFDNLTGDPDQEYFSDGVTEDIITELARRQDLKVIARNSTFFYKGNPKDVRSVAEELGADYVVEGSLQRQGDVLRITAQLIDGKSGSHLWAETYERQVEDVFAVQKDIVSNVVSRLLGEVKAAEMEAAFRQRTDNLQAYELVKLGNYYTYQAYSFEGGTPESIEPALLGLEAYERAIEIDPDYAEAYDWLVHNSYKSWWPKPDDPNEQRLALLEKAIALDPAFAFAHSKMAFVLGSMGRSEEGLAAAQSGIELDPNDAESWWYFGNGLFGVSRATEAVEAHLVAMDRNPLGPYYYFDRLSRVHYLVGNYEAGLQIAQEGARRHPNIDNSYQWVIANLFRLGRVDEARASLERALERFPDFGPPNTGARWQQHYSTQRDQLLADWRALGFKIPEDA